MATSPPPACPDCDCGDSPLSVVANVLSILTFALGVIAYVAASAAVTRGAAKEMRDTEDILRMTRQQIAQVRHYLEILQNRADPDLELMSRLVGDSLQGFVAATEEMGELLSGFRSGECDPKGKMNCLSLSSRLKWWYWDKDTEAGMAKVKEYQRHFAAVQLIFLESKIKRQSDNVVDLVHLAEQAREKTAIPSHPTEG